LIAAGIVSRQTAREARAARGELEDLIGPSVSEWPWARRLSLWVDALLMLEELV
jgi:hypothetical protein